ncbi:tetratricopeptide repeat protein [Thermus tenuipuniceus]|uniref:tetratricopeptide repeat protein n=1 Tax=Thermus tenuipuniceus TaxID=2078690 RepID=UPI001FC92C08|nr:tetratricopeptide repeat protein [Thermus tenuipuniceus]
MYPRAKADELGLQGTEAAAVRGNLLFRLGQPGVEAQIQETLQGSTWAQGETLNLQGLLAFSRGEFGPAAALFARAAVRFLATAETARQVDALNNRAVALFEQGSPEAEAVLGEALKAAGEVPLLWARALLNLGVVRERQGRVEEAQQLYRQSLEAAQKAEVLEAEGRAWNNLGAPLRRRGRPEEAEAAYRNAPALAREGREWMLSAAVLAWPTWRSSGVTRRASRRPSACCRRPATPCWPSVTGSAGGVQAPFRVGLLRSPVEVKRMKPSSRLLLLVFGVLLAACGGGSSPPPSSITLTVVDSQNLGYAAAYQLGNGTWTAFTPSSSNTYTFNLSGNTVYGVAVRCNPLAPGMPTQVQVIQAAATELSNPKVTCSGPNPSTVNYTLNVNVSAVPGITAGDSVIVSGKGFSAGANVLNPANPVAVSLSAPAGAQDLLVTVFASGNPVNYKAAKVLRNMSISGGGSSNTSFAATDALAPANLTVSLPSGFTPTFGNASVIYLSSDNQGLGQVGSAIGTAAANFSYRPVSGFGSGDRYLAFAVAGNSSNVLERYKGSTGGNIGLTLPNPWAPGSLLLSALAHPTVNGLSYSGTNLQAYRIELEDATLVYQVTLGKGWLGTSTVYTFPNLTSQLTYTPFANASTVQASVSAVLSPNPVLGLDENNPASFTATTDIALAIATGNYTVGGSNLSLP